MSTSSAWDWSSVNSADMTVKVIELVPPAVRTSLLPGQEASESAMPLEEFVSEVRALLQAQPGGLPHYHHDASSPPLSGRC